MLSVKGSTECSNMVIIANSDFVSNHFNEVMRTQSRLEEKASASILLFQKGCLWNKEMSRLIWKNGGLKEHFTMDMAMVVLVAEVMEEVAEVMVKMVEVTRVVVVLEVMTVVVMKMGEVAEVAKVVVKLLVAVEVVV